MKLYLAYKKLFSVILKHRQGLCFYMGLACVIVLFFIPAIFSYAQTTALDVQDKISQKNIDIDKLEKEIKVYQTQLDDLAKQKSSLNGSLKELDLTKKKLVADIALTQNKIDKTNLKISSLNSQISVKENAILSDTLAIMLAIKKTNEFELDDLIYTILSQNDFISVWNDIDNMVTVRQSIRKKITELEQIKVQLEDTKKQTLDAKRELVVLKSELADQKKIIEQNTTEKKKLLTQTKNSESNYQRLLTDRLAKKLAFEKELRDYESQLQYILDPSKLPSSGVLSWPLDNIYVTQPFGKTEAGKRLYLNGTHSGTDFRASVGTPVKAMADGIIAGIGDTDLQCYGVSFGRFVFIKYNNGLASTYGHLSLIKVSAGESVARGDIVGYSGNTGYSTGPHLHVSVYARDAVDLKTIPSKSCPDRVLTQPIAPINAYFDPMYYLPPLR